MGPRTSLEKGAPRAAPIPVSNGARPSWTKTARAFRVFRVMLIAFCIMVSLHTAFQTRLLSVKMYGYLIHEFDPWFNYRATEYMSEHGWKAFFRWFDYMSWYPLGRPVGSTTYPGLQFTAVAIHRVLAALGVRMSLNDVCVLIPAWFGSIATALVALMADEMSNSGLTAVIAAFTFMILPAHLMRSMAGEFDNECIAMAAMLLTFYLWVRSLRTRASWPIGALAGVAYGYMAAAWGGYIFVLNMVALHAGVAALVDWARNTYSPSLLRSYALFYVVGTALATRVPPVDMAPFRSLELLGALVVLVFLCGLQVCEVLRRRADVEVRSSANLKIRIRVFGAMAGAGALVIAVLAPTGYFGPMSARVRALFVQHTRTGNPLVDSVAEHQPASPEAFWTFLHICSVMWGLGVLLMTVSLPLDYTPAKLFWLLNSAAAYYFSLRMSRLVLLSGPPACLLTGYFTGALLDAAAKLTFWDSEATKARMVDEAEQPTATATNGAATQRSSKAAHVEEEACAPPPSCFTDIIDRSSMPWWPRLLLCLSLWALAAAIGWNLVGSDFIAHATMFSQHASNPMIVFRARVRDPLTGKPTDIVVDDYVASYKWLSKQTPRSSRVLAWWDYGYQITGIGNRTSLADGNTWNHEHIATIGKMLTSPVAEAHSLVRHMADYVLIWAGQNKDDLMKSPHMARIGNSVYRDICPDDPLCRHFSFLDREFRKPTPTMRASLLYNLHENKVAPGVEVDPALFQEVYTSKYGLVRIYKVMNVSRESKRWVADPANRVCNPPGSWICPGQYPPAKEIQAMLAHRVEFEQEGTFNPKRNDSYYKAYMNEARHVAAL
ncbi:putative mitochondrial oligosaccharyl transferase subunit [Leptomonas pyrrhocoris]|uniref:dolichyl-diphosphooligosaccharide--protein glycotransferase n=1 Tax=Leptomonas pyrrhocoris TaxID=157538 RepID=A0A0N0VHJ4_LEPPY|nr:putative mitochondrial oligosaccharyl transferase subunit [Leptomonas pyrrhocoris]KPA86001.1 putative mitochondrial oligosaccharyl transferase subunit [Leptomonas pyrrhocoris]|eukprot:XP_015664440.1 putative mitochondrial oligosaccharyl transferase subunit [Leptomonas pyrrhocoris]